MKQHQIHYQLEFTFSNDVNRHYFTMKCLPKNEPRQQIKKLKIGMDADHYSYSQDGFHNQILYGYKEKPHHSLKVILEAQICVDWTKYDQDASLLPLYRIVTPLTKARVTIKALFLQISASLKNQNDYEFAFSCMQFVHHTLCYEKGSSSMKTTAEDACANKKGVCQDYAHVMLALLRMRNIPCRYVAGIIAHEHFTHAWVEVFAKGRWYGFDPTNQLLVNDDYIVFARGRDAHDTLINKGIFYGNNTEQEQKIIISMEENNE